MGPRLWEFHWNGEGGLQHTSTWSLKDRVRTSVPSRYQSEALLIHISNLVAYTDQRIQQGADLPDVDSQIRNFAGPKG